MNNFKALEGALGFNWVLHGQWMMSFKRYNMKEHDKLYIATHKNKWQQIKSIGTLFSIFFFYDFMIKV